LSTIAEFFYILFVCFLFREKV